jgi:hypothetical protein
MVARHRGKPAISAASPGSFCRAVNHGPRLAKENAEGALATALRCCEAKEKSVLDQALDCVCAAFNAPSHARQNQPGARRFLPGATPWSA